jgi:hypothetical protein
MKINKEFSTKETIYMEQNSNLQKKIGDIEEAPQWTIDNEFIIRGY